MPGGGGSLLKAPTAQVIVVTNQTLKTAPSEVALHARVAGDPLVTGHVGSEDGSPRLALCDI